MGLRETEGRSVVVVIVEEVDGDAIEVDAEFAAEVDAVGVGKSAAASSSLIKREMSNFHLHLLRLWDVHCSWTERGVRTKACNE